MKRLAKVVLAFLGIFTLTSCMDLLPLPSRRTRSSSFDSEEISESFDDSSSGDRFSSKTNIPSYELTEYYIVPSDPNPTGSVGVESHILFSLCDSSGQSLRLSNESRAEIRSGNLNLNYTVLKEYLEVIVSSTFEGTHQFRVTLKATSGPSRTENYSYTVVGNIESPENYYAEYERNIEVPYDYDRYVDYRLINLYTGTIKQLDPAHPFDADLSAAPSIQILGFELFDDDRILRINLKGVNNTTPEGETLYIKLIDYDGYTFNTETTCIVKPSAVIQLETTEQLIVDYNQSIVVTARLIGSNGSTVHISKEGYELFSYHGYEVTLDYIDNTKIKVKVSNYQNIDEGSFCIRLVSLDGFVYENWYQVCTTDYYNNYYWMQFDGAYFAYQETSYFVVVLYNMKGEHKLIKDMVLTSKYGIVPNVNVYDINAYTYKYSFVITKKGSDEFTIKLTCYDGTSYDCMFGITV